MKTLYFSGTILLALACSSGSGGSKSEDAVGDTRTDSIMDLAGELAGSDLITQDDVLPADGIGDHVSDVVIPDTGPDIQPADIAPEVEECPGPGGGPFSVLCKIGCTDDSDCGNKGQRCLTFRETGQSFCAVPCQGEEDTCPDGFVCYQINEEMLCAPTSGDCNIATAGTDCDGDDMAGLCKYEFPICTSTDWKPGYCTRTCETDLDCPGAFRNCVASEDPCIPNQCRAVWEMGPQGCGVAPGDENGDGAPCRDKGDCAGAQECIEAPGVSSAPGICATPCIQNETCASGSQCLPSFPDGDSYCLPPQCQCLERSGAPYETLLEALDMNRCDVIFHSDWLKVFPFALAHDPWRLKRFHEYHHYPATGVALAHQDVLELDTFTGLDRVFRSIEKGSAMLDRPLPPYQEGELSATLADAVVAFSEAAGGAPSAGIVAAELSQVPESLQTSLIPIVDAMTGVIEAREQVLAGISADPTLAKYVFELGHGFVITPESKYSLSPATPVVYDALTGDFQFAVLFQAARNLAQAIAWVGLPLDESFSGFSASIETPAGLIIIGDSGDDEYDHYDLGTKEIALLVDTGGDDTYRIPAGANASLANAVSVHLDFGGDDYYAYHETDTPENPWLIPDDGSGRYKPTGDEDLNGPFSLSDQGRQGAGRLGVGLLYDFGDGVDEYRSLRISQGTGVFGVGALYDGGGNDTYVAEALVQGAGVFGIGILVDESGDDFYYSAHVSQGFAYATSFGLLYDQAGNDTYEALLGDPELGGFMLYYNPQNPGKSNTSMSQGFGFGRRADFTDGIFMSGGFGILRDQEGDDGYSCDIFGLGTGYWFGTGILADASGDDYYDGRWYVIGAGAHMANGIFIEEGGNDHYNENVPLMNCSVGCGHDFSLGALLDVWGNDQYNSPSLALAAGNADGIGLVWDLEGDDSYNANANNTLGFANSADYGEIPGFTALKCIGLLLDLAGVDSYERPDMDSVDIGNDKVWVNPPAHENLGHIEKGGGIDAAQ